MRSLTVLVVFTFGFFLVAATCFMAVQCSIASLYFSLYDVCELVHGWISIFVAHRVANQSSLTDTNTTVVQDISETENQLKLFLASWLYIDQL